MSCYISIFFSQMFAAKLYEFEMKEGGRVGERRAKLLDFFVSFSS